MTTTDKIAPIHPGEVLMEDFIETGSRVSDFVAHEPNARSVASEATVRMRAAQPVDAHSLAVVMSSRGGAGIKQSGLDRSAISISAFQWRE